MTTQQEIQNLIESNKYFGKLSEAEALDRYKNPYHYYNYGECPEFFIISRDTTRKNPYNSISYNVVYEDKKMERFSLEIMHRIGSLEVSADGKTTLWTRESLDEIMSKNYRFYPKIEFVDGHLKLISTRDLQDKERAAKNQEDELEEQYNIAGCRIS